MTSELAARKAAEAELWKRLFYPGTSILVNKLDLRDDRLWEAERFLVARRAEQIRAGVIEIPRTFDREHLRAIHRELFSDVYEWAGERRDVTTGKEGRWFVAPAEIDKWTDVQLTETRKVDWAKLDRDATVTQLADLYCVLNFTHGFVEGNGRSQRMFLEHVAEQSRFTLDFDRVEADEWNAASRASIHPGLVRPEPEMLLNSEPLIPVFDKIVVDRAAPAAPPRDAGLERAMSAYKASTPHPQTPTSGASSTTSLWSRLRRSRGSSATPER